MDFGYETIVLALLRRLAAISLPASGVSFSGRRISLDVRRARLDNGEVKIAPRAAGGAAPAHYSSVTA
jgi:hypothetical protein